MLMRPFRVTHKVLFVTTNEKNCFILNIVDEEGIEWRAVAWNELASEFLEEFTVGCCGSFDKFVQKLKVDLFLLTGREIQNISGYSKGPKVGDFSRISNPKQQALYKNITVPSYFSLHSTTQSLK